MGRHNPVSYTHLDVYKRQAQYLITLVGDVPLEDKKKTTTTDIYGNVFDITMKHNAHKCDRRKLHV